MSFSAVDISRVYADGTVALQNVSLRVDAGTFVALLGPSGCGKSTLLRLIAGFDAPQAGTIAWDVAGVPGDVGMVFQDPMLLPWLSARDNVALPLRLTGRTGDADAALALVGLTRFAGNKPRTLSGGMRMRVALARAIVTNPRVLLLDEPFAALDAFTREALQLELRKLRTALRCAIVFVTHSIAEAVFLADRIVLMTPGPGRVADTIVNPAAPDAPRHDAARVALAATIARRFEALHAA